MVEHICKKCNKIFYRKDLYKKHLNRKFPCVDKDLHKSQQEVMQDKIMQLEKQIEELTKKMDTLISQ